MLDKVLEARMKNRPRLPKRAVVTGGVPYGNKNLHFGHIGGVFVQADALARFLRDRIGADNVLFVSGTDCYGSPAAEDYRKQVETGAFSGTLEDFVRKNHLAQKQVLAQYQVSLDLFAASALGRPAQIHREMSDFFLRTLHANGHLTALTNPQFYDPERQVFLNGRQVVGRCPIQGCKSDKAYADECALGHQYLPTELISPKSTLTGATPEMRNVTNWYLDMDSFRPLMDGWLKDLAERPGMRAFAVSSIAEFLAPPVIYLKREYLEQVQNLGLPPFTLTDDGKSSVKLGYTALKTRDEACDILSANGIFYRTGKTLVPFRLTGNIAWGVPAPSLAGEEPHTIWVWPESLWAPLSFTQAALEERADGDEWARWWCGPDARVYQFIGQDNVYFYGPAQTALFMGMQGKTPHYPPQPQDLCFTSLVVANHLLFLNKKASSSGELKPPMADELLQYYTAEQLRAHFLGLGLGLRSASFQPKPFNPDAGEKDPDPVLKEGNLLTNVANRIARSCFYTAQKYTASRVPPQPPSPEALNMAAEAILDYEETMLRCEFHQVMHQLDNFIRAMNKNWVSGMKEADAADDSEKRMAVLADSLYLVRVMAVLLHPIAPGGTEMLMEYLNLRRDAFCWDTIFSPLQDLMEDPAAHSLRVLPPRVDFFQRHESQWEA